MAYNFYSGKMASDQLDSQLTNAVLEKDVFDGSLVVLGDLAKDDTYDADGVEYDVYKADAPAAATDEVVIVDYAGISEGKIAGNNYKMGIKLFDLKVPAGTLTRVRRLALHDKFWLGEDNFASTPTVGKYAVATAGDFKHTPAAEKPASGYAIRILASKDFNAGTTIYGKQYFCEVVAL